MTQTSHPDLIFQALASRPRRLIMDLVKQMPGCCVNDICEHFEISRIGVMKHLKILVEAKLVLSRKRGRVRELFFNAAPIQLIYDRWTDQYSAFWATQAVDLKYKVESHEKPARSRKPRSTSITKRKTKKKKSELQTKTRVA